MIQKCLIRREMAKKWRQMAVIVGTPAVFFKLREICPESKPLPILTLGLGCKLSSGITE